MYLLDTCWKQRHNAIRVREGTVTITGSHPHSRWSFCAPRHSILSQYQASYPAILDIATYLSLHKLLGGHTRWWPNAEEQQCGRMLAGSLSEFSTPAAGETVKALRKGSEEVE